MSTRNKIVAGRRLPSLVRCRSGGGRLVAILVVAFMIAPILTGCAYHKQVQYFAATDPDTGLTNYYKMTVTGSAGMGVDYHLQAGYFSAAALDMLRGSMPEVPILDLPVEQLEVFDRLTSHFFAALIQEAKRVHNVSDCEAIKIATKSGKATAERRLGKHSNDLARALRDKVRTESRVTSATTSLTKARERADGHANTVLRIDAEVIATEDLVDSRTGDRDAAEDALAAAIETRMDEQSRLADAISEASALNGQAVAAKEAAQADSDDEAKQQAARDARQAATDATNAAEMLRSELDQPVNDAQSALADSESAVETADRDLRKAKKDKDRAAALEAKARRTVRDKELSLAAAGRALDKSQGKVDDHQVEVTRNTAARDAANEMLTAVDAKCGELDPFSPFAEDSEIEPFNEDKIIELARVIWFGSLSSSDLASIGMTGNTNPYQFRKLVFWATASNIDLNAFAGEIDGILDNVVGIASAFKTQAKQAKKQGKARREAMDGLIGSLPGVEGEMLRGLLNIANPPTDD